MKNRLWFLSLLLLLCATVLGEEFPSKFRILVGTPIRQKPDILREFLSSLERLEKESYTADYIFADDNILEESSELLATFTQKQPSKCTIFKHEEAEQASSLICNEKAHIWEADLIWKVASMKDRMIQKALDEKYDYLFLVDSDLVLHPRTIEHLLNTKKEIVSTIYWTSWTPGGTLYPQVWLSDQYSMYKKEENEQLTREDISRRSSQFLEKLQQPGTYEVGGLGACTLLSLPALQKGVNFKKINNISLHGEDRHFCVRAAALGLSLFVDTHLPAYHIYRDSDLAGVDDFVKSNAL